MSAPSATTAWRAAPIPRDPWTLAAIAAGLLCGVALLSSSWLVAAGLLLAACAGSYAVLHPEQSWQISLVFILIASTYIPNPTGARVEWALVFCWIVGCWLQLRRNGQPVDWGDAQLWICVAGWMGWATVTAYTSLDPWQSVKELARYGLSFFVFLTYMNGMRSTGQARSMVRWWERTAIAAAAIYTADTVLEQLMHRPIPLIGSYPPTPGQMSVVFASVIPIWINRWLRDGTRWTVGRWLLLGLMGTGLVVTASRSGYVAAAVGTIAVVWQYSRLWRRRVLMLLALGTIALAAVLWIRHGNLVTGLVDNLSGRNLLWKAALLAASQHPWVGVGPGCWSAWLQQHFTSIDFLLFDLRGNSFVLSPQLLGGEAHNLFLTKLAEGGVPSLLWLMTLLAAWFVAARRAISATRPGWLWELGVGCIAVMWGLLVRCLFENGPIIGRGRSVDLFLVWFLAALPFVARRLAPRTFRSQA